MERWRLEMEMGEGGVKKEGGKEGRGMLPVRIIPTTYEVHTL